MLIVAIIGALTPTLFFQTYAPVYNNNNTFSFFFKKKKFNSHFPFDLLSSIR